MRINVDSIIKGVIEPIAKSGEMADKMLFFKRVISSFNILAQNLENLSLTECKKKIKVDDLSKTLNGLIEIVEFLRPLIACSPKISYDDLPKLVHVLESENINRK